MERDRRACYQARPCSGANAAGLVVGDGVSIDANLSDDAGAYTRVSYTNGHVVDDLFGQGLDAAEVHVVGMKDLLVPAGAHNDVESAGSRRSLQCLWVSSQSPAGDVDYRLSAKSAEVGHLGYCAVLVVEDVVVL